jgi:hypothetical protein
MQRQRELSNLIDQMAANAVCKWREGIRARQNVIKKEVESDLGITKLVDKLKQLTGEEYSGFQPDSPASIEYKLRLEEVGLNKKEYDKYQFQPEGWNEFIFETKLKLACLGDTQAADFMKEFRKGLAALLK